MEGIFLKSDFWFQNLKYHYLEYPLSTDRWGRTLFESSSELELTPEQEEELIEKLAQFILKYKMETPAILFLETMKPVSVVSSTFAMMYVAPFLDIYGVNVNQYALLFQKRENVERLLQRIEALIKESDRLKKEKEKEKGKERKRKWRLW